MVAASPHVAFRAVAKRFGDGPGVLADLNLTVNAGEFVAVIGPSGCGKSTLLRMIAGLSAASSGDVQVNGAPPRRGQHDTAFIFQDPTLLPWLTVERNIEIPLRLRGTPREERRRIAADLLARVRLEDVRAYYPRELSGGMKMRVSVARALTQAPRLLLLDEPFGALDEMTRHHLNEELLELRSAQSWTAFFVTHSVEEAVFLASRVLVMSVRPGRIVADVPVEFQYPRATGLRARPEFHALVARISAELRGSREGGAR
jgi:NitT/TauT family transport system ATP-binding protein